MPADDRFAIVGALVMDERGAFADRGPVTIAGGRFAGFGASLPGVPVLDASGCRLIPGVVDCHVHLAWSDFHAGERDRRPEDERRRLTAAALRATLEAGVTSARDAGGASRALAGELAAGRLVGPRLQVAVDLIGTESAGEVGRVADAVRAALDRGAQWIKLVATGGVATEGDRVLDSVFGRDEIEAAVRIAEAAGARVMVHSWGGELADWAIAAGAASLEHGIRLTEGQAARAAAAGMTFVPTLTVYQQVHELVVSGALSGVPRSRIAEVVAAHGRAVLHARDAGLAIALGSDFGTAAQHGRNLLEIASLMRAGLTAAEALVAATGAGARLLGDEEGGRIATGLRADAVLLSGDPLEAETFERASTVRAVVQAGRVVMDRRLETSDG